MGTGVNKERNIEKMTAVIQRLLEEIPEILQELRQQHYALALKKAADLMPDLNVILEKTVSEREFQQNLEDILTNILQTQEDQDYILMADYYELLLLPFLSVLQERQISLEEEVEKNRIFFYQKGRGMLQERYPQLAEELPEIPDKQKWREKGYEIEKTSSGAYTLSGREDGKRYYYYSNGNPGWEARQLAASWYDVEKRSYVVYGLGLGYQILSLAEQDSSIQIWVYEREAVIFEIALTYGVLVDLLKQERIHIIYECDSDGANVKREARKSGIEFLLFYPSVRAVQEGSFRKWLELQFIYYQSMKSQIVRLKQNFRENKWIEYTGITELIQKENRKRFFLISAGPSLDDNYLELRRKKAKDVLLATGPVLKKLLQAGIEPDYVVVSDSSEKYGRRLEGLGQIKAPLLFLSTASKGYSKAYPGKKYILCQRGFEPAEQLAKEHGWPLVETGGSVAVVALSTAILLGAEEIIFVGQDLAYSKNKRHANDTSDTRLSAEKGFTYEHKNIDGNLVRVPQNLELFRKRIEELVLQNPQIRFQNATEGGVPIQGVPNTTLKELFTL